MITIKSVDFGYKKQRPLFTNLSATFESGFIYGLLGENGAGKSTLLKLISGSLFPDRGTLWVDGYTAGEREPSFLSSLFMVPEELRLPAQTMKQYIRLNAPFYPRFSEVILAKNAREFEIDLTQRLDLMSLGERKKAYICFGLACQPSLLLMDEPTNGLDIPSKSQFRRVIAQSVSDDRTILISTHQVRDLEQLIDRVSILYRGEMVLNHSMDHITRRLYFGALDPQEAALYSETSIKGAFGVTLNQGDKESKIDLELLFKTALLQHTELLSILNRP